MKLTKCVKYITLGVLSGLLLVGGSCSPAPDPATNVPPVVTPPPVTGVIPPSDGGNAVPGNTSANVGNAAPGNATADVPPVPSLVPTVTIISPADGASVPAGNVTVIVQVTKFFFPSDPSGRHIHYYLDVDAPNNPGQPSIPASGIWAQSLSTNYTFANVSAGRHNISVQLVNHDHTPLSPNVVATIGINVLGGY